MKHVALLSPSSVLCLVAVAFLLTLQLAFAAEPLQPQDVFFGSSNFATWPLSALYNSYVVETQIGTPPQTLRLALAFGSSAVSVPSVDCVASSSSPIHSCQADGIVGFDASRSSSFKNTTSSTDNQVRISIVGFTGDVASGEDTVAIDASPDGYKAVQTIAVAYASNQLYYWDNSQGFLGFGARSAVYGDSLVSNHMLNISLQAFTVGFDIGRADKGPTDPGAAGGVHWGGVDTSLVTKESLTWVPSHTDLSLEEWSIEIDAFTAAGKDLLLSSTGSSQLAAIEPWISIIVAPYAVVTQVLGPDGLNFPAGEGFKWAPCNVTYNASITIGRQKFHLDSRDLISTWNETHCVSALQAWQDHEITDRYRLGTPFMKAVYVALVFPGHGQSNISETVGLSQRSVEQHAISTSTGSSTGPTTTPVSPAVQTTSSLSAGAIAGIVVGGVLGISLLALVIVAWIALAHRKHADADEDEAYLEEDMFSAGDAPQGSDVVQANSAAMIAASSATPPPVYISSISTGTHSAQTNGGGKQSTPALDHPVDRFGRPLPEID